MEEQELKEKTNHIEVLHASEVERPILRHLMELYLYDFSEFDGSDISPMGIYDYPYLDQYWAEPEHFPFLVRVNGHLAGFVLVSRFNYLTGLKDSWVLPEFFIMRKYRHQGVGEYVAHFIFSQFPGTWQVAQILENTGATAFWRKVIVRYTHNNIHELDLDNDHWNGPVQMFTSPPGPKSDGQTG